MSTIILNRWPIQIVNLKEWINENENDAFIILPEQFKDAFLEDGYKNLITAKNYNDDQEIFTIMCSLNKDKAINRIVALDETDIKRAGFYREYFNIPGQKAFSASVYRDKLLMKSIVQENGIPTAPFKSVKTKDDILDFYKRYNTSLILKPTDGMGSMGVVTIESEEDINKINIKEESIIEVFVDYKNMYTVDGIVINNEVVFSTVTRYRDGTLNYFYGNDAHVIELVDPCENIFSRIVELNKKIVEVLPSCDLPFSFHTELFHTTEDKLLFCETASRTGGARMVEMFKQSYGLDIDEAIVKLQMDILTPEDMHFSEIPDKLTAVYLLPKQEGILDEIPVSIPFDWVTEYLPRARKGEVISDIKHSADTLASFILTGENYDCLWNNINELTKYLKENVKFIKQYELV